MAQKSNSHYTPVTVSGFNYWYGAFISVCN